MSEYTHTGLQLVGLHEPEYSIDPGPDGNKVQVELPGHYTLGVEVEGAFVPLARFPAGKLLKDIKRAQDAGYTSGEQADTSGQQSGPDVSALEDRIAALEAAQSASATGEQTPPQPPEQTPSG